MGGDRVSTFDATGNFIREQREAAGLSQTLVARLVGPGWHQATVWETESGRRPLRFKEAVILASIIGFNIADLAATVEVPTCGTCNGQPPEGFVCQACGRSS